MNIAPGVDGIPVVQSVSERAQLFPAPRINQRVHNLESGNIERFDGAQWVVSFLGSFIQRINVLSQGAVGDGVTDDTAAIQAALDAVPATGAIVEFPPTQGTAFYRVTGELTVKANTTIMGYGAELKNTGTTRFQMLSVVGTSLVHKKNVTILGLQLDGNGTVLDITASGIIGSYVEDFRLIDVTVKNAWGQGIGIGVSAQRVWVVRPYINRAWGDGIHFGDQNSGETVAQIVCDNPVVIDCWDDGIGATAGAHDITIINPVIDGTTEGAGLDLSGCYGVTVLNGSIRNYAQHGCRIESFGGDAYDIVIDGTEFGTPLGDTSTGSFCVALLKPNENNLEQPIILRDIKCLAGSTGIGAVYATGTSNLQILGGVLDHPHRGVVLDGVSPFGDSNGPNANVVMDGVTFMNNAVAIGTGGGSTNGAWECINPIFQNVTTYTSFDTQPGRWGVRQPQTIPLFKGASYTTTTVNTYADVDASTHVRKLAAGTRIQFEYYGSDNSGGGAGDSLIQLYDFTNSAVLLSGTLTGGSAGAWRTVGQLILTADAEVGVRFTRSFAGATFTLKAAQLNVF